LNYDDGLIKKVIKDMTRMYSYRAGSPQEDRAVIWLRAAGGNAWPIANRHNWNDMINEVTSSNDPSET